MNDRDLMQEALDALESLQAWPETPENFKRFRAIEALRARLAQPEPEPVAKVVLTENLGLPCLRWLDLTKQFNFEGGELLYTAPPQREWIGLTDEEMMQSYVALKSVAGFYSLEKYARDIEAKLKEKNG